MAFNSLSASAKKYSPITAHGELQALSIGPLARLLVTQAVL